MPVDVGLAKLSNDLIAGGIVAYALGFLGFAIDAAYGNHAPGAAKPAPADAAVARVPAMAGAVSGAPTPTHADAASAAALADGGRTSASGLGLARGGSGNAGFTRRIGIAAIAVTLIGWLLQAGAIASRGFAVHRMPWGNMYEFTLALTFASVTAFLVILARQPVRYLGVFVMTPVVLALGLAVLVLYVPAAPLMPALHSYWLAIHVTAAVIASGVFMVGTAATVMFLVAERYAMATAAGKPVRFTALARMMPEPDALDRTAYRAFAFAFPIWTFAVIAGAIWAERAWGRYWGWDTKEVWTFIIWVTFAGYIHARATRGWRGSRSAWLAIIGFTAVLFNFTVVNLFFKGLHAYTGL